MISPQTQSKPGVAAASPIEKADIAAVETLASHRKHPLMKAAAKFSEIGDQPPLFALGGALAVGGLAMRSPRAVVAGLQVLAAEGLATATKHLLKNTIRRSRPHVLLDEGEYRAEAGEAPRKQEQSFPSGHTAGAVAVAGVLAPLFPRLGAPIWTLAAAVALIQTPRGAHYPSDVAAGAAIGAASAWAVRRIFGLIQRRL
jgi:undecaprenyl-diphosphatase